ncbi:MAG: molybdopterin-synthase adenylyltransferase MoeB [Bacteroidetes bacterium]|nr:molybdopterin-synthase adenylyltransferase MoeB [Bacteroidota bacterium]
MPETKQILSENELKRYSRNILLSELGVAGQEKLKKAKVLAIGAGGIGCPVLSYLAAAGVGRIGVVDDDVVEESNLQRQVLYTQNNIGSSKAIVAEQRLSLMNPMIKIEGFNMRFSPEVALDLINDYDLVIDGSDNFPTRYLINDACVKLDKPFIMGSVQKFNGMVGVFNLNQPDGAKGPTYRCLFPSSPDPESAPDCNETGVLGALPGMIGSMMANETIKVIADFGEPLSGKILLVNVLDNSFNILKLKRNKIEVSKIEEGSLWETSDYENFCNIGKNPEKMIKEITPKELKEKIDNKEDHQLIDVREPYEADIVNISGELIPMGEIMKNVDKIAKDKPVIFHCRSGARSAQVVTFLEDKHQFDNLYNLQGGILAWIDEIDDSLTKY